MPKSSAEHDRADDVDPADAEAEGPSADADADADADAETVADDEPAEEGPFGAQEPTRFAADVEYSGRADGHDYVVRVQHRFLDSRFTVDIDGVEHDPVAEEKARKKAGKSGDAEKVDRADGADEDDRADADADADADDLRFTIGDSFTYVRCTVRRRGEKGGFTDAETIVVSTAGFGGAGEVDVRHGLERTLLVPTPGSPSALRDEKRTAKPTRYALLAALPKAAGYLIPLLGIGALFSGLLDPVKAWVGERVRPVIAAIDAFVQPIKDWFDELLRPVREFLAALFAPIGEAIAAMLRPLQRAAAWLRELLFGWIPDLSLPFSVPGWVVDLAVPVIVVLVVFAVTFGRLRRRREKLAATRAASAGMRGGAGTPEEPDGAGGPDGTDRAAGADGADQADGTDRVSRTSPVASTSDDATAPGVPNSAGIVRADAVGETREPVDDASER
ncbi:hypothetical protein ACTXM8_16065 [Brachybacterium alimentarium]|uniref:hypothetical protein n=1 Tax=Brachybacterium alimentarium TaxID=47845 RepID=UPI003FD441CA